ncbi:MAG: TerC/Alx family metal homeostasis membrane protein [Chlamydiae bacterium]|nr:TerC/Alx family metal homeostasis membrane protein [Chlamydiota bacterium]
MQYPLSFWIGFHAIVFSLLYLDLSVFSKFRKSKNISTALLWTCFWIALSLLFNLGIYFVSGPSDALLFFTGYAIEKSLSIDNIFIFLLIFSSLKISGKDQRRILYFGILGALVFRLSLILLGIAILERFQWMFYVFGAFLCITAVRMLLDSGEKKGIADSSIYRALCRWLPITKEPSEGRFFLRRKGKLFLTTGCVALLLIEIADIVFALDSIPAVLAITTNPFIVYTSNIFAILGLRSLYFVLEHFQQRLQYFIFGLAALLFFIGLKMIGSAWIEVSAPVTLGVIGMILSITVATSLFLGKKRV